MANTGRDDGSHAESQRDDSLSGGRRMAQEWPVGPRVDRPVAPSIYGFAHAAGPLLAWPRIEARLREARNYWLATVRPDGRPHATPLWGVWVDETLYFNGFPAARWARNLAANPAITVHLESGDEVVVVEGAAEDVVTDADVGGRIVAAWEAKYGRLHPAPASDGVFRLRPRTVRAWTDASTFADATRWTWA
jgi:general stress protein 26